MVTLTGGGYGSRQHTDKKAGQKVEPVTHRGNVASVAQQGMATAFKKEPLTRGKGYTPGKMGDTGIAKATYNPATSGPGSQRTTYASGSHQHQLPVKCLLVEITSTSGLTKAIGLNGR